MAFINRLSRLFRADLHAVLDRLEEPELLLRQAIRDMEEEVALRTRQQKARELERRQAAARMAELEQASTKVQGELDLCFKAGNEVLARTLLRRKLENERLATQLAQHQGRLVQAIAEQGAALEEQRRRLEGMRQRAAVFEAQPPADGLPGAHTDSFAVSEAEVDLALLREKQLRSVP